MLLHQCLLLLSLFLLLLSLCHSPFLSLLILSLRTLLTIRHRRILNRTILSPCILNLTILSPCILNLNTTNPTQSLNTLHTLNLSHHTTLLLSLFQSLNLSLCTSLILIPTTLRLTLNLLPLSSHTL